MVEALALAAPFAAGLLLGAVFFGGLWWTVRKALSASRPALWFLASLLLRTGLVLGGFYWLAGGGWPRLAAALAGFVAARILALRLTESRGARPSSAALEGSHAP
ncbi:MAG: ATP synthase subunit I [Acidobacteria bacterium]|nr:ATP synthase subunit I [Acidobacteriota bacterium]